MSCSIDTFNSVINMVDFYSDFDACESKVQLSKILDDLLLVFPPKSEVEILQVTELGAPNR